MSSPLVINDDGEPIALDDVPPRLRALALLFQHATIARDAGRPLPCGCAECEVNRAAVCSG